MRGTDALSRERIVNGLKSFGKLRIKVSHNSIITFSALLIILLIAFVVRMFPLRWENTQTGVIHLTEFDPYYQYSLANYMVKNGLFSPYWPTPWIDTQRWYPDGINMSMSYPALPMTAAFLYDVISALGVNIDLMSFCAILAPALGTLAVLIMYFLGKDIGGKSVALFAALFLALSPSVIQRSALGWFDDDLFVMALVLFSLLFLRSIEEGRPINSALRYSLGSGLALAYFVCGWGASDYPIGLAALFVFVLVLLRRYTPRVLLSYSITFGLGIFIAINVPLLSQWHAGYATSSPIMLVAVIFVLLSLSEILRNLISARSKVLFAAIFLAAIIGAFATLWYFGRIESLGKFVRVINPFTAGANPLTESVAEHRISAWGSIYYELGIGIPFFLAGIFFTFRNLNNKNLFLLVFGLTSLYFASSMVRLLVLLAPAFGLMASVGIVGVLKPFNTLLREPPKIVTKAKYSLEHVGREFSGIAVFLIFIILMTNFAFSPQSGGIPKVYSQAYAPITVTAASLPIAPNQPVQAWLDMLEWTKNNLGATTVISSWWDYGYWLSILGNVTSLADNATINGTQIENIGFTFMANETQALKMLKLYNAKYVLVFTTLGVGQDSSGNWGASWAGYGDEGKWMWMARISGQAHDRFVHDGFINAESAWTDENTFGMYNSTTNQWVWNSTGKDSTIYKLMSWGKQRWCTQNSAGIDEAGIQPTYFKEAYFAGLTITPQDAYSNYARIVPLVCLYEIDWQKYYSNP